MCFCGIQVSFCSHNKLPVCMSSAQIVSYRFRQWLPITYTWWHNHFYDLLLYALGKSVCLVLFEFDYVQIKLGCLVVHYDGI